ncbi:Ig-like domain-containing protein [Gaopeijia maritima]|uniref:Ig-like domain-containing protein n=1 Tax=Gaopeijia maritima TaxID=3119007 RepID=UPI00324ADA83
MRTGSDMRRLASVAIALCGVLVSAWACTDGTAPDATLRLLFDTGTVAPGTNIQLTALDAAGEVVWSSDDPSVADVVSRTGWVTGVGPGTATIRANDGASEVTARIQVRTPPVLRVSAPTAMFEAVEGDADPAPVDLSLTNDGDLPLTGLQVGTVAYGVGETGGWLDATLSGTTAPATLRLSASTAGLEPGTYTATLTVSSPVSANGPQSLAVTLKVLRPATIVLDRGRVELGAVPGEQSPVETVQVTNGGDAPLTALIASVEYMADAAGGWLDADLSASSAPATLSIAADAASLAEGSYQALIRVSSGVAGVDPVLLVVDLVVAPGPAITLSSTRVDFTAVISQASPGDQSIQVTNGGGGTLHSLSLGPIDYDGAGGWLQAALSNTVAPANVVFGVSSGALAPGRYTASVEVRSAVADNSPRTVEVELVVDEAPAIALSAGSLTFGSVRGKGDPSAQALQVTNSGGGTLADLSVEIEYLDAITGWLELSLASTTAPTALVAQPRSNGLQVGIYRANVTVRSGTPGVAARTFQVQYDVKWSFQIDIQPFFTTAYAGFGYTPCTSCHFAGGDSPNLTLPNVAYQALIDDDLVVPFNPAGSRLHCKVSSGSGCGTAMPLPLAQVERIYAWIQQGAAY